MFTLVSALPRTRLLLGACREGGAAGHCTLYLGPASEVPLDSMSGRHFWFVDCWLCQISSRPLGAALPTNPRLVLRESAKASSS